MSTVDLISYMGSDTLVVNAARVSFGKHVSVMRERDKKLINFLARHGHWTPFGHPHVCFYVRAPVFVARQLGKHQVGFVWNEISRRYVDFEPEFFAPNWRSRAADKKQGSGDDIDGWRRLAADKMYKLSIDTSRVCYNSLLKLGVAPEQARVVLPQNMYTEWFWTGSLLGWSRVCHLRLGSDAQAETRAVAEQINLKMEQLFPVSWKELMSHGSERSSK